MKRCTRHSAALLFMWSALAPHRASAEEAAHWRFSGFGTIGAVSADTDDAQFRANPRQTHGAGRSPNFGVDSRIGLQENVNFDGTFSAVGQLIARNQDGSERPRVEWLFGQVHATPWLDLRVGRMVLPVFLISDSINVGYAAHWVRPPTEVYNIYVANTFDGAQAQVRTEWAGAYLSMQLSVGKTRIDVNTLGSRVHIDFSRLYSLNVVAERGNWTLRLGDTESLGTEITGLGLQPPYTDSFRGAGLIYDNGKALLQAEYVVRRTSDPASIVHSDMNASYITGGYRFGPWMPYATYSRYAPVGSTLTASGLSSTRTVGAGMRWEAYKNVAVKAQVESTQTSGLNFTNESPAFFASAFTPSPRKVTVFTLLADFVF